MAGTPDALRRVPLEPNRQPERREPQSAPRTMTRPTCLDRHPIFLL